MSRKALVESLVEVLRQCNLSDAYGINVSPITPKGNPKAVICYHISFCKAAILDGHLEVHSNEKVVIRWQTTIRHLPQESELTCTAEEAVKFIKANFSF